MEDYIRESLKIQSFLDDLMNGHENKEIEFKSAHGGFPGSFWETYSSFANTEGGIIVFGVKEKNNIFSAKPYTKDEVAKLRKTFFSCQNDKDVVSLPLLSDKDVLELPYNDGFLMAFIIPRATREQRPVYVGRDPMTGTFRRNDEGDYRCAPIVATLMFADRESTQYKTESRILRNYTWDDIDMTSFRQYRTMFANRTPSHPWTALDDLELMRKLGGYRKDRETGVEGFTLAGLLMFGKTESITDPECAPDFMLDYREIPADTTITRWVDRIYPDGTWEANLFQFYRLVLPKLQAFMPKPFVLKGDERQDETPAHEALREALINALVHALYGGSTRIVILKLPTAITMSNPGFMLVSLSQYYEGGISECRNPSLQKMFGLIGKSDKAGSGVDKILKGWRSAKWRRPYIEERTLPDKVELYLPMESLISDDTLHALHDKFGNQIENLDHNGLSILSSAYIDEFVTNNSLRNQLELHPADITKLLKELVKANLLVPSGFGRGTMYYLNHDYQLSTNVPSLDVPSPDVPSPDVPSADVLSPDVLSPDVPSQVIVSPQEEKMVLEYCVQWRNATEIAHQIGRNRQHTQKRIIKKLLALGLLAMEYPDSPTSPKQRYKRNE
ncbi:MAG: putative DNA binding domain-containing protein [Muribaculaceae bacterium]|nr:putative DNA binding domain-containing protein [Muribaculaceae bacterium]